MTIPRWRTAFFWCLLACGLVGVGFALDACLPVQPHFMLRGEQANELSSAILVGDGKTVVAGIRDANGNQDYLALKIWDTISGEVRGEVFRGLAGAPAEIGMGGIMVVKRNPNPTGFSFEHLVFSPDRRYCTLMQRRALALADLATAKEWPSAVSWGGADHGPQQLFPIYRLTQQPIDLTPLRGKMKLRAALDHISGLFAGKLPIRVDKEAFADFATDPCEEIVSLPADTFDDRGFSYGKEGEKFDVEKVLHLLLFQVGNVNVAHRVRPDFIEITNAQRAFEPTVQPPVFSPRGAFVVLPEHRWDEGKLHVVACASGTLIASLSAHLDAFESFQFTPDDELFLFFAKSQANTPLLTVWNTQTKEVARTFADVPMGRHERAVGELAPDGKTLLVNSAHAEGGGIDLLDLRTGAKRRLIDHAGDLRAMMTELKEGRAFLIGGDNVTAVRLTETELQVWDLAAGKLRKTIKLIPLQDAWLGIVLSADSRVCYCWEGQRTLTAWNLEAGERLWQRKVPGLPDKIDFSPDRRIVVEREQDRINILHLATGGSHASVCVSGCAAPTPVIKFTPDGRAMATMWSYEPGYAEKWLGKWWPVTRPTGCFAVAETATGRVQSRIYCRAEAIQVPMISDDGSTLLTQWHDADGPVICCWDVPTRPSRIVVVGVPLLIGVAAGGLALARRRASAKPHAS